MVAPSPALSAYDHVIVSRRPPQINPATIPSSSHFQPDQKAAMTCSAPTSDHPPATAANHSQESSKLRGPAIVEEKSSSPAQKRFASSTPLLRFGRAGNCLRTSRNFPLRNSHAEYYLTDMAKPPAPRAGSASSSGKRRTRRVSRRPTRVELSFIDDQTRIRKCTNYDRGRSPSLSRKLRPSDKTTSKCSRHPCSNLLCRFSPSASAPVCASGLIP